MRLEQGIPIEMESEERMQVWNSQITVSLQGKHVRNGTPNNRSAYIPDYQANLSVVMAGCFQDFGVCFIPKRGGMSNMKQDILGQDQICHSQIFTWFVCLISVQTKTPVVVLRTIAVFFNNELGLRFQFLKDSCIRNGEDVQTLCIG